MKRQISSPPLQDEKLISSFGIQRRNMLKFFGASAAVVALGSACRKNHNDDNNPADTGVFLGAGDFQILNFAYALEQLEAAFYIQVVTAANFTTLFPTLEQTYMNDIRDHEVIHREFFKAALGMNAIQGLDVDFSKIDFTSRASVLGTAKVFEDTGVAAYNGAGKLIKDPGYLLLAGKIVSVEARHASTIRDLLQPLSTSFAGDDIIDNNGLDGAKMPSEILAAVQPFVKTKLSGANLPTA